MAQVPYSPVSDVHADLAPTPTVHVDTPLAAFGGDIATAMGRVGAATDQLGSELFARANAMQELKNQADADTAATQYGMKLATVQANFLSQYGANAGPEALEKHATDLAQLRMDTRQGLTNPMVQQLYDRDTLFQQNRAFSGAALHSAQQLDIYQKGAAKASADAASDLAVASGGDAGLVAQSNAKAARAAEILNRGAAPETVQQARVEAVSGNNFKVIKALADDPNKIGQANQLFAAYAKNGTLVGKDRDAAREVLDRRNLSVNAKMISDGVMAANPNATPSEMVAAGKAIAKKQYPENPLLEDAVQGAIETKFGSDERLQNDDEKKINSIITTAMLKAGEAQHPINSIEDLRQTSPEVAQAIDKLPAEKQGKLQTDLKKAMMADDAYTPVREANANRLRGLAYSDDPSQFTKVELTNENLRASDRKQLASLQQKALSKEAIADPLVDAAKSNGEIKALLRSAGIYKRQDESENGDYYQFWGAVHDEVNSLRTAGKEPNIADMQKIVNGALKSQNQPDEWSIKNLVGGSAQEPLYLTHAPPSEATKIKQMLTQQGKTADEATVNRVYRRTLLDQTLKGGQ